MPRSGGEYVYNSRIIHPVYGIAQSFGDAAIWLMWLYVLAPLAVDPGLTMTFNYLGWSGAANWLTELELAHLPHRLDLQRHRLPVRGLRHQDLRPGAEDRHVLRHRRLLAHRRRADHHVARLVHGQVERRGGRQPRAHLPHLHRPGRRRRPGTIMPTHTNWGATFGTMVAMSWLFAYAYSIAFIAGEVKRPDKSIIWANTVRHRRAVRVHALDRHRALQDGRLPVPERHRLERQQRQHAGLDGRHAARHELHRPGRVLASAHRRPGPRSWRLSWASRTWPSPCGGWRSRTWPSRASCSPGAWTAWARSGSPTSTRATRARSRTTSSASSSARAC